MKARFTKDKGISNRPELSRLRAAWAHELHRAKIGGLHLSILVVVVFLALAFPLPKLLAAETNNAQRTSITADEMQKFIEKSVEQQLRAAVTKEVTEQEDAHLKQLKWFIAFVALVGLGTFGTLAKYIIEKAVESGLERRTDRISQGLAFSRFYTIALKLDLADSFSQPDVDAVMNYLRKVEKNSDVRHSPEFLAALLQVAISFTRAGQSASMDELFQIYEREILSTRHLVQPLLHHYGQEIIAREFDPIDDFGYRAFEKLERVAPSSQIPELSLAYRTIFESRKQTPEAKSLVEKLVQRSVYLDDTDRTRYLGQIILRSRTENWVRSPTPESIEIQKTVRRLFAAHAATFKSIYGLGDADSVAISTSGVSREDSEKLAAMMASSVASLTRKSLRKPGAPNRPQALG